MAASKRKAETHLDFGERMKDELLIVRRETRNKLKKLEEKSLDNIRRQLNIPASAKAATNEIVDTRIKGKLPVIYPEEVAAVLPLTQKSADTTLNSRKAINNILKGEDERLLVITGPCSIHNAEAALEYADWVKDMRSKYSTKLEIIMRAYMEKPRTETGWKGFTYDPRLDNTNDINLGLIMTRMVAIKITEKGIPIAVERLNALTPQYINGLVAYDVIGARNTVDQKAREYASGTSSPIGFKNTPDGNIENAVSAVVSATHPHDFLGISSVGLPIQVTTAGNPTAHIVLRGGSDGPNYSSEHILKALQIIRGKNQKITDKSKQLLEAIIIDASHANSGKDPANHAAIIENIAGQIKGGEKAIKGVMLESNLVGGRQSFEAGHDDPVGLTYGQSITDACSSIDDTEKMLQVLADSIKKA